MAPLKAGPVYQVLLAFEVFEFVHRRLGGVDARTVDNGLDDDADARVAGPGRPGLLRGRVQGAQLGMKASMQLGRQAP